MPKRLHQLLRNLPEIKNGGLPDVEITALTADSRLVNPGSLFVAIRGSTLDGHQFIQQAVDRGAVAVVGEAPDPNLGLPYLQVPNSRLALARFAASWFDRPASKLVMVGVTGTDGKSTTVHMLTSILQTAGLKTGMISSVHAMVGDETLETGLHVTTPGPMEVQELLTDMVEAGVTHCVLEATSHGLAQHRVSACEFDLGIVTNITHEHLDFHGSYDAYIESKTRLFEDLSNIGLKAGGPQKMAILNKDDSSFAVLQQSTGVRKVSYGRQQGADIVARDVKSGPRGIEFVAEGMGHSQSITSELLGEYNVSNCLAAFTAGTVGLAIPPGIAAEGISKVNHVDGRMERIGLGQPFLALVDFAHTPNGLLRALEAARSLTRGRVIAVIGSAGLRDKEKRRKMAENSAELADLTILTAEDPRTESLDEILAEMADGARKKGGVEGETFWRIPDRGEAIRFAVKRAVSEDLVIACGKGHEQSMCFGETEYPWDDRTAMRAAISELMGIAGPVMPRLPTSI